MYWEVHINISIWWQSFRLHINAPCALWPPPETDPYPTHTRTQSRADNYCIFCRGFTCFPPFTFVTHIWPCVSCVSGRTCAANQPQPAGAINVYAQMHCARAERGFAIRTRLHRNQFGICLWCGGVYTRVGGCNTSLYTTFVPLPFGAEMVKSNRDLVLYCIYQTKRAVSKWNRLGRHVVRTVCLLKLANQSAATTLPKIARETGFRVWVRINAQ